MTTMIQIATNTAAFLGDQYALTVRDTLTPYACDYVTDYDWDAIEADYRSAVDALLPNGYIIAGECVYIETGIPEMDEDTQTAFQASVSQIDLDAILKAHETTPTT